MIPIKKEEERLWPKEWSLTLQYVCTFFPQHHFGNVCEDKWLYEGCLVLEDVKGLNSPPQLDWTYLTGSWGPMPTVGSIMTKLLTDVTLNIFTSFSTMTSSTAKVATTTTIVVLKLRWIIWDVFWYCFWLTDCGRECCCCAKLAWGGLGTKDIVDVEATLTETIACFLNLSIRASWPKRTVSISSIVRGSNLLLIAKQRTYSFLVNLQ